MSRSVKGLLIKDFKLMKSQMRFFIVILIVWGVIMASGMNASFLVGYTAMLSAFLTLTTFSYDEFENGTAYLFTLPVLRRDYIRGKYLFGFLIITLPTILVGAIVLLVCVVRGEAYSPEVWILTIAISILMAYLLLALEVPIQVRFGQEKSRMISTLLIGCMAAGYGVIKYLIALVGVDGTEAVSSIAGLGMGVLVLLVMAALVIVMLVSYKISCRFMEKKEF